MKFLLCRHGQTEANAAQIMSGTVDTPLTMVGVADAVSLSHRVCGRYHRIYSSDLGRSFRTAMIINFRCGMYLPPIVSKELREMDYGDYNYCKRDRVIAENDFYNVDYVFPNGESFRTFQSRVIGQIADLARASDHSTALLVTHSGVIRAINDHFGQYDIHDGKNRKMGHSYLGYYEVTKDNKLVHYEELD